MIPHMRTLAFVALALVPVAGAATPTRVIDSNSVGAYQVEQSRSRAIAAFGAPTESADTHNLNLPQGDATRCRTWWRSIKLFIEYTGPCSLSGRARIARVQDEVWRTREGLRVGATERRLKQVYRGVRLMPIPSGSVVERRGFGPLGREWDLRRARPSSQVIVTTRDGRVIGFELRAASLR